MRPLFCIVVFSLLLAACASPPEYTHISQSGNLKVHPALLGQPVPPEMEAELSPGATASGGAVQARASGGVETGGMKMDEVGLRTQRSVYFDLDSALVKTDFAPMVQAHAQYLTKHPGARVRIEGNADERGSAGYNQRLGMKRAEAVRRSMLERGVAAPQVRAVSLGKNAPRLKGHDEASWAENRRADVVYEQGE